MVFGSEGNSYLDLWRGIRSSLPSEPLPISKPASLPISEPSFCSMSESKGCRDAVVIIRLNYNKLASFIGAGVEFGPNLRGGISPKRPEIYSFKLALCCGPEV